MIDLERYPRPVAREDSAKPLIGWIGSPASQRYFDAIAAPVSRLLSTGTVRCRLIGATKSAAFDDRVELVSWSEASEVHEISRLDIGVMPLPDDSWARGKCAYKLIQYMACGLPVVASPVGMNRDVVKHGVNGFLATTATEWEEALSLLASDAELRHRMGQAGRRLVEQQYCLQVTGPRVASLFRNLVS